MENINYVGDFNSSDFTSWEIDFNGNLFFCHDSFRNWERDEVFRFEGDFYQILDVDPATAEAEPLEDCLAFVLENHV